MEAKLQARLYAICPHVLVYIYSRTSTINNHNHALQEIISFQSEDGLYQHQNKDFQSVDNKCHKFYIDIIAYYNRVHITTSIDINETSDKCISKG